MKSFQLTHFNEFNGAYEIWFGNRICVGFHSKRHLRAFLADTNKFLTKILVELNDLFSTTFREYREIWLTCMNYKNGKLVNLSQAENKMQRNVVAILEIFDQVGNTYNGASSGSWSFIHLSRICFILEELCNELITVNKSRNNTVTYHSLEILKERIKLINERISNYPPQLPENGAYLKSNK